MENFQKITGYKKTNTASMNKSERLGYLLALKVDIQAKEHEKALAGLEMARNRKIVRSLSQLLPEMYKKLLAGIK